ncbi:MAG: LacI family transcriptional regulator [Sphingobacteriaceae bacterium]|nr:MAG: LacI family transcriptional regulator [Sphingobacteriaceae bacterium]
MKNQKRATIHDIARKLNIAASSVSRALNNSSKVSDKTKKLVLETAKELNYKQNYLASNLRKGHNQTIGVVVPRINQNFFSNVIAGLEEVTYKNGYNLVICQSNELHEREVQCVETLINQHVSCIVISISAEHNNSDHLKNALLQGIQMIQFDRVALDLETYKVINDNEMAATDAVLHMISQGYKRIALLEGPQNLAIFRQRKAGYIRAMEQHKIPLQEELIIKNAWTKELGAKATRKLLSMSTPPDAIFASTSDFSALGVLEVANNMGINVPQTLGICGYSNEAFSEITTPSITTVDQYSKRMGKAIADLYFQEVKEASANKVYKTVSIKPKLIIRSSTQKNSH